MDTLESVQAIAGHAMKVLGKGHTENIYHRAMITALNRKGIPHRSEVICPIMFMGEIVGTGRADLVVENVVVELKSTLRCPSEASPQLRKYIESLCIT